MQYTENIQRKKRKEREEGTKLKEMTKKRTEAKGDTYERERSACCK